MLLTITMDYFSNARISICRLLGLLFFFHRRAMTIINGFFILDVSRNLFTTMFLDLIVGCSTTLHNMRLSQIRFYLQNIWDNFCITISVFKGFSIILRVHVLFVFGFISTLVTSRTIQLSGFLSLR